MQCSGKMKKAKGEKKKILVVTAKISRSYMHGMRGTVYYEIFPLFLFSSKLFFFPQQSTPPSLRTIVFCTIYTPVKSRFSEGPGHGEVGATSGLREEDHGIPRQHRRCYPSHQVWKKIIHYEKWIIMNRKSIWQTVKDIFIIKTY